MDPAALQRRLEEVRARIAPLPQQPHVQAMSPSGAVATGLLPIPSPAASYRMPQQPYQQQQQYHPSQYQQQHYPQQPQYHVPQQSYHTPQYQHPGMPSQPPLYQNGQVAAVGVPSPAPAQSFASQASSSVAASMPPSPHLHRPPPGPRLPIAPLGPSGTHPQPVAVAAPPPPPHHIPVGPRPRLPIVQSNQFLAQPTLQAASPAGITLLQPPLTATAPAPPRPQVIATPQPLISPAHYTITTTRPPEFSAPVVGGGLTDGEVAEFETLLDRLEGTNDSIRASKEWIVQHKDKIQDIASRLRKQCFALPEYEKKLHILYAINDILFHYAGNKQAPESINMRTALQLQIPSILQTTHAVTAVGSPEEAKLEKMSFLWQKYKIFTEAEVAVFKNAFNREVPVPSPPSPKFQASSGDALLKTPANPLPVASFTPAKVPIAMEIVQKELGLEKIPVGLMSNILRIALKNGHKAYTPINVAALPPTIPPAIEPARLEARIAEFYRSQVEELDADILRKDAKRTRDGSPDRENRRSRDRERSKSRDRDTARDRSRDRDRRRDKDRSRDRSKDRKRGRSYDSDDDESGRRRSRKRSGDRDARYDSDDQQRRRRGASEERTDATDQSKVSAVDSDDVYAMYRSQKRSNYYNKMEHR